MSRGPLRLIAVLSTALLAVAPLAAHNAAGHEFNARTVTLIVGLPPGGGYDVYARIIARHLGNHLPGSPPIVVQNQPGAGSMTAANLVYNTGPKDGSQLLMLAASAALEPTLGNTAARFDVTRFTWIGNIARDVLSCGAWTASGVRTWDDALRKGLRLGGSGPAAITTQHAAFLVNVLQAPFKVIGGYSGTGPINLAMQRGEVDGSCGLFLSSAKGAFRADIEAGRLAVITQFGKRDEPYFGKATNVYSLLKSDDDRRVTEFVFGQAEITRPIAAPPGLPPAIATTLRSAFDQTMKDAAFLADAERAQIEIAPLSGEETAHAFAELAATPRPIVELARRAIAAP